jgi:hypothetical protein
MSGNPTHHIFNYGTSTIVVPVGFSQVADDMSGERWTHDTSAKLLLNPNPVIDNVNDLIDMLSAVSYLGLYDGSIYTIMARNWLVVNSPTTIPASPYQVPMPDIVCTDIWLEIMRRWSPVIRFVGSIDLFEMRNLTDDMVMFLSETCMIAGIDYHANPGLRVRPYVYGRVRTSAVTDVELMHPGPRMLELGSVEDLAMHPEYCSTIECLRTYGVLTHPDLSVFANLTTLVLDSYVGGTLQIPPHVTDVTIHSMVGRKLEIVLQGPCKYCRFEGPKVTGLELSYHTLICMSIDVEIDMPDLSSFTCLRYLTVGTSFTSPQTGTIVIPKSIVSLAAFNVIVDISGVPLESFNHCGRVSVVCSKPCTTLVNLSLNYHCAEEMSKIFPNVQHLRITDEMYYYGADINRFHKLREVMVSNSSIRALSISTSVEVLVIETKGIYHRMANKCHSIREMIVASRFLEDIM